MNRFARKYGPVLFWQFAWFAAVALPLAALTAWLAADRSLLMFYWSLGLVLAATFGFIKIFLPHMGFFFLEAEEDAGDALARPHRLGRLAMGSDLRHPVFLSWGLSIPLTGSSTLFASDYSFGSGLKVFLSYWAILFAGVWLWWAFIGRHPDPESLPRPALPGADLVDARFLPQSDEAAPDTVAVAASPRMDASTEKIVYSIVLLQLLPAISGGSRRWTVRIGGEPVAVLTQTWEHPRWWPPIEWVTDKESSFSEATISFSPASEHDFERN